MLRIFSSLTKAIVAVAAAPVVLVADVFTLPGSAMSKDKGPFHRTEAVLKAAGRNLDEAIKP